MPGSATLGDNLIDDLVETVDELRADLYEDFGVTQFAVYLVRRTWNGGQRNEGVASRSETLMDPTPLFVDENKWRLMSHGRDEVGDAALMEVSLTYTEAELSGGTIADNEEFYYKLVDLRGQGHPDQFYTVAESPTVDRERNIGWMVKLRRAQVTE